MNGFINFFKESGLPSNQVLNRIKRLTSCKKAGFLGTLDPIAEGVLPIGFGFATKLFPYIENTEKTYQAEIIFGSETDTQDDTGNITKEGATNSLTEPRLQEAILLFLGEIEQVPPMYSAKRVDGKRLYELARKGEVVERPAKKVTIHNISLDAFSGDRATITATVSKGTYIRTLCESIGRELGVPAHMGALIRTKSHIFDCSSGIKLADIEENQQDSSKWLLPLDYPIQFMPKHILSGDELRNLRNGIWTNWYGEQIEEPVRLYSEENRFIGLGKIDLMIRKLKSLKLIPPT